MMYKLLKPVFILSVLCNLNITHATEKTIKNSYVITQQQWSVPKKAQSILRIPALHSVMKKFAERNDRRLVIRYPGGDTGVLWAAELKGWLVALGLASKRIELQSGSSDANELKLFIN